MGMFDHLLKKLAARSRKLKGLKKTRIHIRNKVAYDKIKIKA
jgi:hypothetical protein